MAGSLQDQFLKAGLINEKQAKKARHESQRTKKAKKSKGKASAPQDGPESKFAAEQRAKAEHDRKLNEQLAESRAARETESQVKQLLDRHGLTEFGGDARFNYEYAGLVRSLMVTEVIRSQLAAGQLAIAGVEDRVEIVPAEVAGRIQERGQTYVRFWTKDDTGRDDGPKPDDPYAEYVVPDDLTW